MFEIQSNIEKKQKLPHEIYQKNIDEENLYLKAQNQILRIENKKFANEIELLKLRCSHKEIIQIKQNLIQKDKIVLYFQEECQRLLAFCSEFEKQQQDTKLITNIKALKNLTQNPQSSSLLIIFKTLSKILTILMNSTLQRKQIQQNLRIQRSKISLLNGLKRKEKQLIYIVKEPNQGISNFSYTLYEEGISFIRGIYEKIINKIKRTDINSQFLYQIYEDISLLIKKKNDARKQESKLKLYERSDQLTNRSYRNILVSKQNLERIAIEIQEVKKDLNSKLNTID